jgi:hypothetical protein
MVAWRQESSNAHTIVLVTSEIRVQRRISLRRGQEYYSKNRNTAEHVAYIFNHIVPDLLAPDAMPEAIAISVGAVEVVDFLNNPKNQAVMEPRLTALALVATFHQRDDISDPWVAAWLL